MTAAFAAYRRKWRKENADKVAAQNARAIDTQRNWRFRREYKINLATYEILLLKQEGKCAICQKSWQEFTREFAVDHDHVTGKIRGLLCFLCNTKLAVLESSEFMDAARRYLGAV